MERREFLKKIGIGAAGALIADNFTSCSGDSQGSVIATENARTGDPAWVLSNPAIQREIEGYASATSVNRGGSITFYVSTGDPQFSLEVFRLGWYGGAGARKMLDSPVVLPGVQQATPMPDPMTGLIECSWDASYELKIPYASNDPTVWASGVYLAKLTGSVSGKQSYIIFVLRDDLRFSKYLFQSSVTTFQAYNNWGGKSLYDYNSVGGRAAKVSFNRPYGPSLQLGSSSNNGGGDAVYYTPTSINAACGVGAGEFLTNYVPEGVGFPASWECNMLRFLERNGYDVTYATNIDNHENPNLLLNHRAFLSVGHDEYWSWEMRSNAIYARDAGINLGFFAADVCYWQIRFEPSAVTGAPNRTQVCYKSANDPVTGLRRTLLWRDLGLPEAQLVGIMYLTDRVDADIVVQNTSHWIFADTGLSDGDPLPGLLGYEVDATDASSPANLVVLGNSPSKYESNPVMHSQMATYTAPSGATVFAAGSMEWSWGLDDYNAPAIRPSRLNAACQKITQNILSRLGQP